MEGNHNIWGITENLKKICKEKGIKPYSLIKKKVRISSITSILEGRNTSIEGIYEVAKALGVSIEELITGRDPRVNEEVSGYGMLPTETEYMSKLKTILKSGNEPISGMVKAAIDAAVGQIDDSKKTRSMAG